MKENEKWIQINDFDLKNLVIKQIFSWTVGISLKIIRFLMRFRNEFLKVLRIHTVYQNAVSYFSLH